MAISQVTKILGLREKVKTHLDFVALSEKGLPRDTVLRLAKILSINYREIAHLLMVSQKTIERFKSNPANKKHLTATISERILRIAIVAERCREVFNDPNLCNEWLKSNNTALGGLPPIRLMSSDFGIDMVLNELGRIEHGIIS